VSAAALGGLEPIAAAGAGGGEPVATGTTFAGERVQQLHALLAEIEHGPAPAPASAPATFASALDAAQSGAAEPATAVAYTTAPAGASAAGESSAYAPLIEQAAARYGLDPALLSGLIQQESGFDPSARSGAGALGLTQLMPSTAASLGVAEPLDPAQSIEGGARYLSQLLHQFAGNTADALAAYNAGPGAVEQYGGVPPYSETQQYVTKVLGYAASYSQGATPSEAIA
jgi:soluble lytic murein transglycosylase-like protein